MTDLVPPDSLPPGGGDRSRSTDPLPAEKKPVWTSLEVAKLLIGALVPVSIFVAGITIAESARFEEMRKAQREAIQKISQAILHRRARSELLHSSIKRHFDSGSTPISMAEVVERKKAYDEVYAAWNADIRGNLLVLREAGGGPSRLDDYFQRSLSLAIFKPMDACLTKAYDLAIREKEEAKKELYDCDIPSLLGKALNCGFALTEQAQIVVHDKSRTNASMKVIEEKCPPPATSEAPE